MHVRQAVRRLQPYRPGQALRTLQAYGLGEGVKLGSNENPLGPAPQVRAAMQAALEHVRLYPDPGAPALREALASHHGLRPGQVIAGAGIDDLLDLVVRCVLDPGDRLVLAHPGFVRYRVAAELAGGEAVLVPGTAAEPYRHDVAAMLAAVDERTRIVVLVNPNNPTGARITRDELERYLAAVPPHVLTILDEAYFEFVDDPEYPDGMRYLRDDRALLVFRTFSKCHALAGIRIGYGAGPEELIGYLDRARLPFNVNRVAEAAALAALGAPEHVQRTRNLARAETAFLTEALRARGWKVEPTWTNFVFAEAPCPGEPLAQALLRRGFILRPLTAFGLPDRFFRISHGTRAQNEAFVQALDEVRAGMVRD